MRCVLGPIALLSALGLLLGTGPAAIGQEQDWVAGAFPSRQHDFGTVARGSKVHHSFKLVNTTAREIHIVTYRTKCGCTEVKLGAQTIPPGTQTVVEAVIDTTKFTGPKASGLTLVIDRPQFVEVDLNLNCFIRGDLTLNPGQADFGAVNRTARPSIELALSYGGGQAGWAITKMVTQSEHIKARLSEAGVSPGGPVNYTLAVTLNPSAPVGFFRDEITLHTNDPTSPTIPISVSAIVGSNVSVTPSVMTLGQVRPGETIKKVVLIRSAQPFKLAAVRSTKDELTIAAPEDKSAPLHSVTISFKAPAQPGPFHAVIEVQTDVPGEEPAKINAFATVVK